MKVDWDIAERERHVIGDAPRIEPVAPDALDPASVDLINEIRAAAGAGPATIVPEYMRTMIRHPRVFRCQMELGTVLFQGAIPARERELAILRVGWLCGAPYEWGQHVAIAKRVGVSAEEIERARQGSKAAGWSEHERAIVAGVEELLDNKALSDATWNTLAQTWDEEQLIEFPMMVGQYVATAYVQNTLRVRMEGGNEGLARK
ncbi:carboxymuconolactone decarboxylase family protein [Novosphingobium sp. M1R2S20]|uniref:Carboxymuconolactone decarboxylase family protein n=1 Tax=Novosphingobium rhizovicinum TaxID=3228928 RepID=A0ABV3RAU1_9SPHN